VHTRYFWQVSRQIYGHIRCIYTVLANPIYIYIWWVSRQKHVCRRNEQGKLGKYHPAWCTTRVGQNHIYIRCIYDNFGRDIIEYTVIHGDTVYIYVSGQPYIYMLGLKTKTCVSQKRAGKAWQIPSCLVHNQGWPEPYI